MTRACNLASLNLMKFLNAAGQFETEAFRHAVDTMIIAQEILVDNASYPTERIAINSHNYRPLGLGYANLGALLMACGLPYDSDPGREFTATVTALMHGQAYLTSSRIAATTGPFPHYESNSESVLDVISMHRAAFDNVNTTRLPGGAAGQQLATTTGEVWRACYEMGTRYGYRNAQVTVLAPTGTIGFMMDCATTGIEPDLALIKYKKLIGGGVIKVVNNTVADALLRMNYSSEQVSEIVDYIDENGTIEGAPHLNNEHLAVFDCSLRPTGGVRSIAPIGHVRMMAAAQPFLSGAISKTVNMPDDSTVEDTMDIYMAGWRLGLKAIAIYRDGSKKAQPLSAGKGRNAETAQEKTQADNASQATETVLAEAKTALAATVEESSLAAPEPAIESIPGPGKPVRHKLPAERDAITHKFSIGGHEGYITAGKYENGLPGEIFIVMAKEGSTVSGLMDSFATAISLALQYGVPLKVLVDKFSHTRFEPSGWTGHKDIGYAKSIMDYIFRWLALRFLPGHETSEAAISMVENGHVASATDASSDAGENFNNTAPALVFTADAPTCSDCGSIMTRNGSCYKCENCGATSGCS